MFESRAGTDAGARIEYQTTMKPQPTEAAIRCAEQLSENWDDMPLNEVAECIDHVCNLPALTVVALAAQGVIDAGRPHGGVTLYQHPDGCECEQCEAWDTLKSAVDALEVKA